MNKKTLLTLSLLLFAIGQLNAQILRGRILNSITKEAVPYAGIRVTENHRGTSADAAGSFQIELKAEEQQITISSLGFESKTFEVQKKDFSQSEVIDFYLFPQQQQLQEVRIIAAQSDDDKRPYAINKISSRQIEERLGTKAFPEIMQQTPGVYASRTGGGYGDAAINLRGFKQENISLLLNGVPVNSFENGLVYWSNWQGLTDATAAIEVQRGLAPSQTAMNAVGGTINIITKGTEAIEGSFLRYDYTSYGNSKVTVGLNSGKTEKGWAFSFIGSRSSGPGYVGATYVDAWSWFLSISKDFGSKHKLVFTGLGSPEKHGQRNLKLSQQEIDEHGLKFNKDWGSYNGEIRNLSENFYHKPQLALNHYWTINGNNFLATSAYFSFGYGGGRWNETFDWNTQNVFSFRNPSGQIDWDGIYQYNADNDDYYVISTGDTIRNYARNILTHFLADHYWAGILSSLDHKFNDHLSMKSGIHARTFKSWLKEEVNDLLGAEVWIDNYAWAADGVAGRNELKKVGDITRVDNSAIVRYTQAFTQLQFEKERFMAFASASVANNWYAREDRYQYVDNQRSETISMAGFDAKAGLRYSLMDGFAVWANGGYFSRAPYYKFVFPNYNNNPAADRENERITTAEVGFDLSREKFRMQANAYYSQWKNKSLLTNEYLQLEDNSQTRAMISGLDAEHMGIELEAVWKPLPCFSIGALASIGNWEWKNNVNAVLFNHENIAVDTLEVYADGLKVGDAPQTQFGIYTDVKILRRIDLHAGWMYFDRMYADFDPAGRNDAHDKSQSYQLPAWSHVNMQIGYPFYWGKIRFYASANCDNLLDEAYIVRGEDGAKHNLESFRGFWSFGRTFSFSLKAAF